MSSVESVLVIGSGPIVIGQAAEFDYAGTQACRALREEGVRAILVNSNPATIMTDPEIADVVYVEPLTVEVVERIIRRERPEGLLATLGGQTGLNLAVALAEAGVLDRYGVRLLGTPLSAIRQAEDRDLFKRLLRAIGEPVPDSTIATNVEDAVRFADQIGYPVVIRPAFTLGGTGGGFATNEGQLRTVAASGISASPIGQVLVERSLLGWKELEYEVMRDGADTCITVCNMENVDPMGVHTGDSIVVAPSQTLSDIEYQMLRSSALRIIRALGIEGGCNIQFALDPHSRQYYVIEVNPRVSRSSALASKATGYPIARVSAKIALGKRLDEIQNAVTGRTCAAYEPALDYLVVKIPRWPFDKFTTGDRTLGTQMKATGEVMAIDRCFEAALQKAVRSLEFRGRSLLWEPAEWSQGPRDDVLAGPLGALIDTPNDQRLWAIMAALRRGVDPETIARRSGWDRFFVDKLANLVQMERRLLSEPLSPALLRQAKRLGFSDVQIGHLVDRLPEQVREQRILAGVRPVYKMVDTCAAEFEAQTPYFYSTYETENEAPPLEELKAVVLGSGPIRIGQGIEFDYCSVHAAKSLREAGVRSIMVNSNPETVSTDFDASSRLYFEPLDEESVRDVLDNESLPTASGGAEWAGARGGYPPAVLTQFGGQTAINLADPLARAGYPLFGSDHDAIDRAEDRARFEETARRVGVPQPPGTTVFSTEHALAAARRLGYPVIVRPSYVLGGWSMAIARDEDDLRGYAASAVEISPRHPLLIDKYFEGTEIEVDAIADGIDVLVPGIMEHIERAGVHSGDSIAVYPARSLTDDQARRVVEYTVRLGRGLGIKGLFNVQYVVYQGQVYVLEANPRASRTVPFLTKATGVPMVDLATRIGIGQTLAELGWMGGLVPPRPLFAVKAPVFSMSKLPMVDSYLGPEMKSTGEVMGVDRDYHAALAKALIAAGLMPPRGATFLLSIADRDKPLAAQLAARLHRLGCRLAATEGTAKMLQAYGLPVRLITKKLDGGRPNVLDAIQQGEVQAVVNTLTGDRRPLRDGFAIRRAAVERRIPCFTALDTLSAVVEALEAGLEFRVEPLSDYLVAEPSRVPA